MKEIHIMLREVRERDCSELLQQLEQTIQHYKLHSKITVNESSFWVPSAEGHRRLYYSGCHYIETEGRHLLLHYENETLRKSGKLSDILKSLPETIFFRCNNSYIVNLNYIVNIMPEGDRYNIRLQSGAVIPLSRSCYKECRVRLGIKGRRGR